MMYHRLRRGQQLGNGQGEARVIGAALIARLGVFVQPVFRLSHADNP